MSFTISSTLSISRKRELNCEKVAEFLGKAGLITDVTKNISYQRDGRENGCRLTQSISSKSEIERMWTLLKKEYELECAHLHVLGKYDGCVLNYIAPSQCLAKD